ncbi:MAG: Cof-type HAD-IIB family hydrolase [Vampirovibrionales bacterium]|nr:Cof-type HAD-IIB family hydrolase [Vampirovibrionales bacterium]
MSAHTSIQLIAFDLDGTLLNEQLLFSPRVVATLARIQKETAIKMVLATGRMFASALPFAQALGFQTPLVAYQGGMTRETAQGYPLTHHLPVPLDAAHALIDAIEPLQMNLNVYVHDVLYTSASDAISGWYANLARVRPKRVSDIKHHTTSPPTKMVVIDTSADAQPRIDAVKAIAAKIPGLSWCESRSGLLEIMHENASKWSAVQQIADRYDISPEHIMAIGDHENDLSMITQAGVGVAMGNGPEHVRAMAPYVTGSVHDDGAAQALDRFVFGQ